MENFGEDFSPKSTSLLNLRTVKGLGDISKLSIEDYKKLKSKRYLKQSLYEVSDFKHTVLGVFTKEGCCKFLNKSWGGISTCITRKTKINGLYTVKKIKR